VLSALYILIVVLLTALPCHFYLMARSSEMPPKLLQPHYLNLWLTVGIGLSMLIAAIVTAVPMRMGLVAFRRLEV